MSKLTVNAVFYFDSKTSLAIDRLNKIIEKKLGDGWAVTRQTDGICLVDIHANNYAMTSNQIITALNMNKEDALIFIGKFGV